MADVQPRFLGQGSKSKPTEELDFFPNPHPERDGLLHIWTDEFTCFCPVTGQPDFAKFRLWYIPDELCVELKALKLYLWTFRDKGSFHEKVTGDILNKLVGDLNPRFMHLVMKFNVRGGLFTDVQQTYRDPDWTFAGHIQTSADGVKVVS